MSENTVSGFDAAVAVFAGLDADSSGAPRPRESKAATEVEGEKLEALENEAEKTPVEGDEPEADADEDSAADQDDQDGDRNEDDDADSDGAPRDDEDEKEDERGRLRHADYTKKSQELAEQRKAVAAEFEALRQDRANYAHLLSKLSEQLVEVKLPTQDEMIWLRDNDPQRYLIVRQDMADFAQRKADIESEQQRLEHLDEQQQVEEFNATVASEMEILLHERPEWRDKKVFAKAQADIREYARDVLKYSEREIQRLADHRAMLALADATETHKLKKIKAKPVRNADRSVKPGSSEATPRRPNALGEAIKRQSKERGSISATADVFRHLGI